MQRIPQTRTVRNPHLGRDRRSPVLHLRTLNPTNSPTQKGSPMAKYRLQTLLELRERTKKEKEEQLAEAKKNLQNEQQKLEQLRKQLQDMRDMRATKEREMFEKASSGELGVNGWVTAERYLKRLDKEIEEFEQNDIKEQEKVIAFAEQEVEWANEEMLQALQEYKALEKHKENWETEYKKEMAAKEELNQEEIAQALFNFKDRD
ncbi:hypothetical protein D6783_00245 [Candidatus Woesearchaeota archaeon]|nr:MAG: hypothetical protein D6783_00245 [Candidatus Woesearchaeota archaeon]